MCKLYKVAVLLYLCSLLNYLSLLEPRYQYETVTLRSIESWSPGLSELVEDGRPVDDPAPPEPALDLPRRHPEFSGESADVGVGDLLLRLQRAFVALLEDSVGGRRSVRLGL